MDLTAEYMKKRRVLVRS